MAALTTALDVHKAAFLHALTAGDDVAVTRWERGRGLLTRPQRICTEAFALGRESFEHIADRTGYLVDDVAVHIAAAVRVLIPDDVVDNQIVKPDNQQFDLSGELSEQLTEPEYEQRDNQPFKPFEEPPRMSRRVARQTLEQERDNDEERSGSGVGRRWINVVGWGIAIALVLCLAFVVLSMLAAGDRAAMHHDETSITIPAEVVDGGGDYTQPDYGNGSAEGGYTDITSADTVAFIVDSTLATGTVSGSAGDSTSAQANAAVQTPSSNRRAELTAISKEVDGQPTSKPQIGRREYNAYLAAAAVALPKSAHGEVTMTFKVNAYGRPSQIRVTSTFSREANHEAIRLLSNGPEWTESQRVVTITIVFRE